MSGKSTTIYSSKDIFSKLLYFKRVFALLLIGFLTTVGFGQESPDLQTILLSAQPLEIAWLLDRPLITYQDIGRVFPDLPIDQVTSSDQPLNLGELSLWLQSLDANLSISLSTRVGQSGRQALRDLAFLEIAEPFWDHRALITGRGFLEMLSRYLAFNPGTLP